jgi:hypothetical protein
MKLFRNQRYAPVRNPRYAPEFLERRLNPAPAGFVAPVSPPVVATVAPVAPDDAVVSPAVDYSLAIADPVIGVNCFSRPTTIIFPGPIS